MEHNNIPQGEIHAPYQWVVQDQAERLALVPTMEDINKTCLQTTDGSEWRLAALSPAQWMPIKGALSADPDNRIRAGSDQGAYVPQWEGTDPLAYYILAKS